MLMFNDYLKTILQWLLPKWYLTCFAGLIAESRNPVIKNFWIRWFIRRYSVNMQEAQQENPRAYACFNDFFIRKLKATCRPLASVDIISPVDGYLAEFGQINQGCCLQAKGRDYTVSELLACEESLSSQFERGHFLTFYLSPKDYHRIHMPIEAKLTELIYVPGRLFSVQPTTTRMIPRLFSRNERLIAFFDTPAGSMAMVLVGAVIVGAISTRWGGEIKRSRQKQIFAMDNLESDVHVEQGEEMGYFKLGSTVVLLFANQQHPVKWCEHLVTGMPIHYGEALGSLVANSPLPLAGDG